VPRERTQGGKTKASSSTQEEAMIRFTIEGTVPSKKNAWRRRPGQLKAYVDPQIQADIDALVILAQSARNKLDQEALKKLRGKKLHVIALFGVKNERKDLDNIFTTLLDVLQKAAVIENDNLVRAFSVYEYQVLPHEVERVDITIAVKGERPTA
jgi:Holliday junction resolvase RusA-like endonuclease